MNGDAWELERGVDFDQMVDVFRNRFYVKGRERNLGVHTTSYLQAINEAVATRLAEDESSRRPVHVLPVLIRHADDPQERKELRDRLTRLKRESREYAELLAIQFYGEP